MSVDMTKWQELAKANIHNRPTGEGRLAGKITIVTGAAQGFGKGIAEELYKEGRIESSDSKMLQSIFRFRKTENGGYINTGVHRLVYGEGYQVISR